MSSIINDSAMESMFDAEMTTATLLEAVKANVANTVKTVDAAASLENKLSEEAAQFNACLTTMSNSIRKCESGEISREEMLAECAPCVSALKEKCVALKLADVKATGNDITEDEIAMLKEYIVGCKDIVADRKKELQDAPIEAKAEGATEGVLAALADFEPATEGQGWQSLKAFLGKSTRDARKAVKLGKAALKKGDKEDAVKYLTDAKKLFEDQKAQIQKLPKDMWETTASWLNTGLIPMIYSFIGEGGYKDAPNKNVKVAAVMNYLNRAIKKCNTLILQAKAGSVEEATEAMESMINFSIALESLYENFEEVDVEPATEASMVKEIRKSTEAKTAAQLYKQAKKLYGLGSKEQALTYLKKAQKLYEGCLAKAEKSANMYKVEREVKAGRLKDTFERNVTDNIGFAYLIDYFEDRIDACKALEMQWNNKAGKSTYAETKAQLKAERKEARAAKKAAKKAEKEAATESYEEDVDMVDATEALGMSVESFIEAMESEMDAIELDLALDAATEAEGESGESSKASGIGARLRAAFGKLKKAKKTDDAKGVKEAQEEISKAADELAEASKDATPEEKKRLSKAAKLGIAAGATAAIVVGAIAIGKHAENVAKGIKEGEDPTKYQAMMKKLANGIGSVKTKVGNAYVKTNFSGDREIYKNTMTATGGDKALSREAVKAERANRKASKNTAVNESFLEQLAFGLESVIVDGEDVDNDKVEPMEGKAFDDEDLIEEANESELDELATEAAIAVMMAEDGLDDSDLD